MAVNNYYGTKSSCEYYFRFDRRDSWWVDNVCVNVFSKQNIMKMTSPFYLDNTTAKWAKEHCPFALFLTAVLGIIAFILSIVVGASFIRFLSKKPQTLSAARWAKLCTER